MAFGISLMVVGLLGYIGSVLVSLMMNPMEDDIRVATLLTFLSIISFMLGAIMEVRDLRYPIDYEITQSDPHDETLDDEDPKPRRKKY